MKSCKRIIALFIFFTIISGIQLYAQPKYDYTGRELNTITTAVPFLIISPDARSGAMGDAGVSSSPDANSLHWNPAKYAFIKKEMGFSVSYSPWLRALVNDINLAYVSGYTKFGKDQALSASLLFFSLGDITFTDIIGTTIGQFKPNEFAVDLAYSRKLSEKFSGGVSLRYIRSNLTGGYSTGTSSSHPGNSVATDVSVYYQNDIKFAGKDAVLALGANISNIGNKISYTDNVERDFIPMNLRFGPTITTQIDEYNSLAIMIDINKLLVPTPPVYKTVNNLPVDEDKDGKYDILSGKDPNVGIVGGMLQSFSDAPGGFKEELKEYNIATGIEYWYDKQFALRAGYFHEDKTKGNRKFFTVGAGLKYNVFSLDFAYLVPVEQRNPLENTLRFSLLFDFDAFKDQPKTE